MNHQSDWNEEEDNFDLTLSQRTEELSHDPRVIDTYLGAARKKAEA